MEGIMIFCILVMFFFQVTEAAWKLTGSASVGVTGESFTLTCTPDRSNVKLFKWRRNGIDIANVNIPSCSLGSAADTSYTYSCDSRPVSHLTIPPTKMTPDEQNTVWTCEDPIFGGQSKYTLTVHVPVSSITIQGESGYPDVSVIYENQPKQFTCITNACYPKANITVLVDGVTEVQFTERFETRNNLFVTIATQTVTATRGNQTKSIRCNAANTELRPSVTSETITMEMYYPPTAEPFLTGYTPGEILYEDGGTLELNCQQEGGSPLSNITWSCLDQIGSDNSTDSVSSSIVYLAINRTLNGKTCTCFVKHPDTNLNYMNTKSVNFNIHYIPTTEPSLTGYTNNTVLYEGNRTLDLNCKQSGGNPLPNITWSCVGQPGIDNSTENVVSSYLNIPIEKTLNGKTCTCIIRQHDSKLDYVKTKSVGFLVHYTPSVEPSITGYTNGTVLYEGDGNLQINCQQPGGNPLSNISWSCLGHRGSDNSTERVTSSNIHLTIDRNLNGINCTCVIRQPDDTLGYTRTNSIIFQVYYPPSKPVVYTLQENLRWIENNTGILKCNSTHGFPRQMSYRWLQNSLTLDDETNDTLIIAPLTSYHDKLNIRCRVDNEFTVNRHAPRISDKFVLSVQYKPFLEVDTDSVVANEGTYLERKCTGFGNPRPVVNWYRGAKQYTFGAGEKAELIMHVINKNDTDTYTCKAISTLANNIQYHVEETIDISVKYVSLEIDELKHVCQKSASITINCYASGTARNYKFVNWTHSYGGKTIRTLKGNSHKDVSSLSLDTCDIYDQGIYTCYAGNDIYGNNTWYLYTNSTQLEVESPPVISVHTQITVNENANEIKMSVSYMSVPKPDDIKWIKDGRLIEESDRFLQVTTPGSVFSRFYGAVVSVDGYTSSLLILAPTDEDYGVYTFEVQNSLGAASIDLTYYKQDVKQEKDDTSYYVVGGAGGGVLLVVVFVLICSICICRKCRKSERPKTKEESNDIDAIYTSGSRKIKSQIEENKYVDIMLYETLQNGSGKIADKRPKRQREVVSNTYDELPEKHVSQQYTGLGVNQTTFNKEGSENMITRQHNKQSDVTKDIYDEIRGKPVSQHYTELDIKKNTTKKDELQKSKDIAIRRQKKQTDMTLNVYDTVHNKPLSQQYTGLDMENNTVKTGFTYDQIKSRESNMKVMNVYEELHDHATFKQN